MTENLAGRGEGLAGLVAELDALYGRAVWTMPMLPPQGWAKYGWNELVLPANAVSDITKRMKLALEAAAPAGTAPTPKFPELKHQGSPIVGMDYDHKLTVITTELFEQLVEYGAALATPSPQAPQEQCNAFSTTSAREQSSATASDMLNVSELAEHITYKIQSLLTDKYTNSFRIACGVIEQELKKAVNSMPHDALVGEAFYCELRHTCDWCGQDLRGAGFDGHYNIYCHKPDCAKHLIIPTCDCDPEYPHHCVPAATQEQPAGSGAQCHAAMDGDCMWEQCPQLRDGEPVKSGRHCPLDTHSDEEETQDDAPGSPRKVGEDAPEQLMTATGPVSLADFSRNLADDIYAISDGAAPDRETLRAMIRARLEVGLKYWKWERAVLGRPSSVPVGEQK